MAAQPLEMRRRRTQRRRQSKSASRSTSVNPSAWRARFAGQPPAVLALECALFIALLMLLYLTQVVAVDAANMQLQVAQTQHTQLQRLDDHTHERLAFAESPAYIERRAIALGLRPTAPGPIIAAPNGSGR